MGVAVFKKGLFSWDFEHAKLFAAINWGKKRGGVVHSDRYFWFFLLEKDFVKNIDGEATSVEKFDLTHSHLAPNCPWCLQWFGGEICI